MDAKGRDRCRELFIELLHKAQHGAVPHQVCTAAAEAGASCLGEMERLREGLDAAIRAANLALFVIRKQGVMPNSSWQAGFERDMATANAARGDQQTEDKP